jgi:hypothetical protein
MNWLLLIPLAQIAVWLIWQHIDNTGDIHEPRN